jgi:hypothetical protein
MNGTQLARWAPIGGIIFVVLIVIGTVLVGDHPDPDATPEEITDYLGDSGAHTRNIIGAYLWVLAGIGFLWFLTGLRSVLRTAEGAEGTLSNLGFGAGVVFTALLMAAGPAIAAVAAAIEFRDAPVTDPDFIRVLPQMGYGILLLGGGFTAIVLLLTTSAITLQTGVFPQWLAWLGIVAAIVLLFAIIFLPMVALLIWVLAVSVVLLMQREETATVAA